jgi:enterochelin esterase-like enzyme
MHSQALEGNVLGDSPDREVLVYLPPGYEANSDRRYPVVYSLHGNSAGGQIRLKSYYGSPLPEIMDPLIAERKIGEIIIVQPNSINRYGGSQYANSTVSGNWADFIVHDLVAYIDRNYRTLAKPESRGLTGHSMGGRGALYLSLQYPGIFGVVYATSPDRMAFHKIEVSDEASWRTLLNSTAPLPFERELRRLLGYSVAFSPNPQKPPYFADFPKTLVGNSLGVNEAVMKRWATFDPAQIVEQNADPYRGLRALSFDCGTSDPLIDTTRLFSTILAKHNISHLFEEYDGGHTDKKNERFKMKVLPMFSKYLVFE